MSKNPRNLYQVLARTPRQSLPHVIPNRTRRVRNCLQAFSILRPAWRRLRGFQALPFRNSIIPGVPPRWRIECVRKSVKRFSDKTHVKTKT
jgi:hypothetical protein